MNYFDGDEEAEVVIGGDESFNYWRRHEQGSDVRWFLETYNPGPSATGPREVPAGFYSMGFSPRGPFVEPLKPTHDQPLAGYESPEYAEIKKMVAEFWQSEKLYQEFGITWKRGVLLHGQPGTGKTMLVYQLCRHAIEEHNVAVLVFDAPDAVGMMVQQFRRVEPERPVIILLEDLDQAQQIGDISRLCAVLDGEAQTDRFVFLSTTNNLPGIDHRLRCRPSRVDSILEIPPPPPAMRFAYLKERCPRVDSDTAGRIVKATDGLPLAHLKELVIATQVFGMSVEEAAKRVQAMKVVETKDAGSYEVPESGGVYL